MWQLLGYLSWKHCPQRAKPVQKTGEERSVILSKNALKLVPGELRHVLLDFPCAWSEPQACAVQLQHRNTIPFHLLFLSHPSPASPPKKAPKQTNNNKTHRKQCYVEASVSPQRYWPTEPKWNKFPQLELKRAWQVYRTCMNLTSEQKSLLSRGSCPLLFFSQHLKAGTSHEKFMQQCVWNIAMKDPQHLLTWANPDG